MIKLLEALKKYNIPKAVMQWTRSDCFIYISPKDVLCISLTGNQRVPLSTQLSESSLILFNIKEHNLDCLGKEIKDLFINHDFYQEYKHSYICLDSTITPHNVVQKDWADETTIPLFFK